MRGTKNKFYGKENYKITNREKIETKKEKRKILESLTKDF